MCVSIAVIKRLQTLLMRLFRGRVVGSPRTTSIDDGSGGAIADGCQGRHGSIFDTGIANEPACAGALLPGPGARVRSGGGVDMGEDAGTTDGGEVDEEVREVRDAIGSFQYESISTAGSQASVPAMSLDDVSRRGGFGAGEASYMAVRIRARGVPDLRRAADEICRNMRGRERLWALHELCNRSRRG